MNENFIIGMAAIFIIVVFVVSFHFSDYKQEQSKKRYMNLLIEECYNSLVNTKTGMRYHSHKFDWDYQTSTMRSTWDVWTEDFAVTAYGTSEQTRDVKNIDEFFNVSTIEYVTVFLHTENISVLHHYYDKKDINRLISAMKTLESNNNYKCKR